MPSQSEIERLKEERDTAITILDTKIAEGNDKKRILDGKIANIQAALTASFSSKPIDNSAELNEAKKQRDDISIVINTLRTQASLTAATAAIQISNSTDVQTALAALRSITDEMNRVAGRMTTITSYIDHGATLASTAKKVVDLLNTSGAGA